MLAIDELHLLWRREMVVDSYRPSWVKLDADGRQLIALTFVVFIIQSAVPSDPGPRPRPLKNRRLGLSLHLSLFEGGPW